MKLGSPGRPPQPHSPPSYPSLHHPICRQQCCPLLRPCSPLVSPSGLRSWVWQGQGLGLGQEVLGSRGSLSCHTLGPRKVSEQGRGCWGCVEWKLTRGLDRTVSYVPITIPGGSRSVTGPGCQQPQALSVTGTADLGHSPSGTGLWRTLVSAGAAVGCARISLEVSEETPVTAQPAQLAAAPPIPGLEAAWTSFSGQ